ncbi:MAG: ABC transporter substrate-binding protein [Clostridia bacterium]|nr:ABC transporter substrate-binding protein [Clostridia bacterium]
MKRIFLLTLALLMLLPLAASCQRYDGELSVNVWVLNGTTGFGIAPLIEQKKAGESALNYTFTVESNAANVQAALINDTADIAALPTNAASALYNKTNGEVVVLALNTRGVLYLVANTAKTAAPTTLADLAGKTVYCPAQNPAFVTKALLDKAELAGATLDSTTYAAPADLRDAVASGLVDLAVLPEPMVTIAISKAKQANAGVTLTAALDLTAEWESAFGSDSLVQGCVVASMDFVENHPEEVKKFLEEYELSINYTIENPKEASEKIAASGVFEQAAVAEKALPKCNLCFITGTEMKNAMHAFLSALPFSSIGGALPADDFYFSV